MSNSLQTIFDYNLIFFGYKISGLIDMIINHIILFILSQLFGSWRNEILYLSYLVCSFLRLYFIFINI